MCIARHPNLRLNFSSSLDCLRISLMIGDPFVVAAFRRAEDDGLAPALVEIDHPRSLDGGAAELLRPTVGRSKHWSRPDR